ncbi:MAG: AbrB/MazE/SpoVT family DNA-binding domain-containing protein [Devosia sp.]|uniref:antitoxin n=1 Tax=Devosia sp. TaxID=1871048 RepID=UPI001ACB5FAD|nr:AbrB/MazE/SpoVT family DNA-binding domain-containing protein [Devosia sp.]MBN9315816.1 AbrB/MazE/SpoVT family DNA-binding domain-containing protein [Devosia sp.]
MSEARKVSLFRNGRNKALRIPVEFEPEGDEVIVERRGEQLIISPVHPKENWLDWLRKQPPLGPEDQFPDISDDELPLQRDVSL